MSEQAPVDYIKCLRCGSLNVKMVTWILPRSSGSKDVDQTLAKYDLNQTKEFVCQDCGNKSGCRS